MFKFKRPLAEHAKNAEKFTKGARRGSPDPADWPWRMCGVRRPAHSARPAHSTGLGSALSANSARDAFDARQQRPALERLEDRLLPSAGELDVVFAGGKSIANFSLGAAQAAALAVQADSKIVAVGQAGSDSSNFALARFNLDGTLDTSFEGTGEETLALGPSKHGAAEAL